MAKTRRNRKNRKQTRKNRKQRGAGFFDFFTGSSTPAAPVANAKAPLNGNVPTPAIAPVETAPRRSFMNRIRNAAGSVSSSLRQTRNTANSTAKNY